MIRRTRRFIADMNLHRTVPVELWPLEDIFPIRRDDLAWLGCDAMIVSPEMGWPAHHDNQARVVIDHAVSDHYLPTVYAHEIGHAICQHDGVSLLSPSNDRKEREAWMVAAMLLIPNQVVITLRDQEAIAAECGVPVWLVQYLPPLAL